MAEESTKGEISIVWFFSSLGMVLIFGELILGLLDYLGYNQRGSYLPLALCAVAFLLLLSMPFISNRLRRQK